MANLQPSRLSGDPVDIDPLGNYNENVDVKLYIGYRFRPKDHDLVMYYLKKRIEEGRYQIQTQLPDNRIRDVQGDVFICTPLHLFQKYELNLNEVWYFFCTLKKEYYEDYISSRLATTIGVDEGGYWKFRISREVIDPNAHADEGQTVVGHKMIYQFYQAKIGKMPGAVPTGWFMAVHTIIHKSEIAPVGNTNKVGDHIVMCKIYNRDNVKRENTRVRTRRISTERLQELQMNKMKAAKDNDQTAEVLPNDAAVCAAADLLPNHLNNPTSTVIHQLTAMHTFIDPATPNDQDQDQVDDDNNNDGATKYQKKL